MSDCYSKKLGVDQVDTGACTSVEGECCVRAIIGSVRRELLAHILILSERHLFRKVKEYVK